MTNITEPTLNWRALRFSDIAFGGRRLDRERPEGGYRKPKLVTASDGRLEYWYTDPVAPLGVVSNEPEDDQVRPAAPASSSDFVPPAAGGFEHSLVTARGRTTRSSISRGAGCPSRVRKNPHLTV
jgi:hypothetical protein